MKAIYDTIASILVLMIDVQVCNDVNGNSQN